MFWAYNATSPQIDIILCKEVSKLNTLFIKYLQYSFYQPFINKN